MYPGDHFEHHLRPFRDAFDAGTSQVMPYYGMPVGTRFDEVGFGFNKSVITGLLRDRFAFDGIVCTDWALITDHHLLGADFPARAWGVEHLSPRERTLAVIAAGVDQFGGEDDPALLVDLVRSGAIGEPRIDESARRLLREKFVLGLFDEPYVDPERAERVVGADRFRDAGLRAQQRSVVLLTNDGTLPLPARPRLYTEGIDPDVVQRFGVRVDSPAEAHCAVLRLQAPYRQADTAFESFFHAGALDFPDAVVEHVRGIAAQVPTVVDVFMDRPAILTPIVEHVAAITANFGAHAGALLGLLVGESGPTGRLPFDLPSSTAAVEASRTDVPFDTADPLFRFGHGLRYGSEPQTD